MRYTSDLTDPEWNLIAYCFPKPSKKGRRRKHTFRELLKAIFYLTKTGCQWRYLPKDFAPWRTVYHYFRLWKNNGLWEAIHAHLREPVRLTQDRKRHASAASIDSQSVKRTEMCDERGYDAGKKVNGRKRHILVDAMGLILMVLGLPANIQDRDGARQLLKAFFGRPQPRRRVKHIWADGGYAGTLLEWSNAGSCVAPSRSSSAPNCTRSKCCHVAGWSNEPLAGCAAIADSIAITSDRPTAAKPLSIWR